jgi:hypothetical protein
MPLSRDFDDVYRLGILPACEAAGAYGERVDEQIFDESILRRIYNQIAKADLIVSDMSGRNANVFYETGYAHALGKTVILLTRDVNDIPFDLKHYPHIVYGGRVVDLVEELERRVRFFANKSATSVTQANPIDVHVNEVPITSGSIRIPVARANASLGIDLKIDIRNSIARQIRTIACQIGLLSPRVFVKAYAEGGLSLPRAVEDEDRLLHYSPELQQLLPGAWRAIKIRSAAEGNKLDQRVYSFAIRVFTEVGPTDHPFELELEE